MRQIVVSATPDGRYWIDVSVGGRPLRCFVDTGLTDRADRIGFELEPTFFDLLHRTGSVHAVKHLLRRDSSGKRTKVLTGESLASLIDPVVLAPIGQVVRVSAIRGAAGLPSRVGVAFFHKLTGCRVDWNLSARTWTIDVP